MSTYFTEMAARDYTRDRLRDAEAGRAARIAVRAAQRPRYDEQDLPAAPAPRRRRIFSTGPRMA